MSVVLPENPSLVQILEVVERFVVKPLADRLTEAVDRIDNNMRELRTDIRTAVADHVTRKELELVLTDKVKGADTQHRLLWGACGTLFASVLFLAGALLKLTGHVP